MSLVNKQITFQNVFGETQNGMLVQGNMSKTFFLLSNDRTMDGAGPDGGNKHGYAFSYMFWGTEKEIASRLHMKTRFPKGVNE